MDLHINFSRLILGHIDSSPRVHPSTCAINQRTVIYCETTIVTVYTIANSILCTKHSNAYTHIHNS